MSGTQASMTAAVGEAVLAASEALLGEDLAASMTRFLTAASRAVGADAASIILVDKGTHELFFAAATGEKAALIVNERIGEDRGVAGEVLKSGMPLLLNSLDDYASHYSKMDEQTGFESRQMIACPMRHDEFVFGVLELINSQHGLFEQEDLLAARILANMASAAIWQSRTFARAFSALALDRAEFEAGTPLKGRSRAMASLRELVPRIAVSDAPILIRGESGVGKEVLARLIWKASRRRQKTFLAVNCAAIPPTLIESELFGHERGAFTGAHQLRKGRFEAADKGTLFLDEIGELPLEMQAKLLRVLQEMEFTRVGGTKPIRVDVRVLAATNRNLDVAVKEKTFREDLFYRLAVIPCTISPLRDRPEDIPELVEFFLAQLNASMGRAIEGVTPECRDLLLSYHWPGNVRELRNVIERLAVLSDGAVLDETMLPAEVLKATRAAQNA